MKNQKTNLQELNYRFVKVLLNDTANKSWLTGHYEKMNMINGDESDFNYSAWCKGLFRNDSTMLLGYLESIYLDKGIEFDNDAFVDTYEKGSLIDLININTFVSDVLYLWCQEWDKDFSHELTELHRELYYEKCKNYSFTQFLQNEAGGGYDLDLLLDNIESDEIVKTINDFNVIKKGNPTYAPDEIKAFREILKKGYINQEVMDMIN